MTIKLDEVLFHQLLLKAGDSLRKRSHLNIHKDFNEPVQRLCIGMKKGTYVRPHHHPARNKWELIIVLKGKLALLIFDSQGVVTERIVLGQGEVLSAIELPANTWHTVFPLTDEAIILEVKEGPYIPAEPSDFASWAPEENTPEVEGFLSWLAHAKPGQSCAQASI